MKKRALDIKKLTLITAKEQLRLSGKNELNVRMIAKQCGYSIGTFYNLFDNLDDLLLQLNGETLQALENALLLAMQSATTPQSLMRQLCTAYITFAREHQAEWQLLFETRAAENPPAWYQERIDHLFRAIRLHLKPLLGGSDAQADQALKILWASIHGICSLTLSGKLRVTGSQQPEELCETLFHHFLVGYRVSEVYS